ncbi:hypothetical protein GKC56_07850 [Neisseriaceae bacterium PsAf]|nr:hypothetical protein [Neisseriaceae bacterium PsAf]MCV2503399.1 hypothetical protein [Neisseriaceae bacterium]
MATTQQHAYLADDAYKNRRDDTFDPNRKNYIYMLDGRVYKVLYTYSDSKSGCYGAIYQEVESKQ